MAQPTESVFDLRTATDVRNRIKWLSHFYQLSNGSGMPLSFTETRFVYEAVGGVLDFDSLLKEWKKQPLEGGDASGDSTMVNTDSEEFKIALKRLNEAVTEQNVAALKKIKEMSDPSIPEKERLSEDQILVGIGVHLVKKLTGKGETTWKRSHMYCPCGCNEKLDYSDSMFIGSEKTWHGELDIRSLDVGITASVDVADDETSERGEDEEPVQQMTRQSSNGRTVNLKFKKDVSRDRTGQQVIAQSIVFGWTQFNKYPNMSAYIPTVFIDSTKFGVFVYNPNLDSLLISEYPLLFYANKMSSLSEKFSGILILWMILHHRLFFKKTINYWRDSRFKAMMGQQLEFYKKLNFYSNSVKVHTPGTQWGPGRVGIRELEERPEQGIKRKHSV